MVSMAWDLLTKKSEQKNKKEGKIVKMNIQELEGKRIAVLLSGGVDSSVVVYEFARLGLHPDCFYIKIGPEEKEDWDCNSEEDLEMATLVARRFGCKLEVIDCHKEYWDQVTRYTMEKVKAGFTPNPDVMCNRLIKFGAFDEKMGHDYDLIATGHYAQTEWIDGRKWLTTSPDPVKDQTDFLAQIYDWQLKKAIFPIGHYEKNEVREIAERENLINAHRKDSQGICFLGNIDYNEYVRRYLGEEIGDVIGITTLPEKITFKIRHTPEYHPATVEQLSDGRCIIHSTENIHGVAPGQFCVVYDEQHHRCFGSGEITL